MKQQLTYNPGVDFLKGIAIIGIVLYHIFPYSVRGGFLGVCFFFIISGYLAAKQAEINWVNQEFSFKTYYRKKFKRLYPPMFVMVMSVIAFFTLFHQELLLGVREETVSIFLGVNNWWQIATHASYFTRITNHSPFIHLWYMGVEMELLLIWPLCFWVYKKCRQTKISKVSGILFVLIVGVSIALMAVLYGEETLNRVYCGTDTRAFAFFMGVLLAICEDTRKEEIPAWLKGSRGKAVLAVLLVAAVSLFFVVQGEAAWLYRGGMAGICLLYTVLLSVINCCGLSESVVSRMRILQWIGKHSYQIYLWHYPVLFILWYLY